MDTRKQRPENGLSHLIFLSLALASIFLSTSFDKARAEHSLEEVIPILGDVCKAYYQDKDECERFKEAAKEFHGQNHLSTDCLSESNIEDMEFFAHLRLRLEHLNLTLPHPIDKNKLNELVKLISAKKVTIKNQCLYCKGNFNCIHNLTWSLDLKTNVMIESTRTLEKEKFIISPTLSCNAFDILYKTIGEDSGTEGGNYKGVDLKIRTDAARLVAKSKSRLTDEQEMEAFEGEKQIVRELTASALEKARGGKREARFGLVEYLDGSHEHEHESWYETRGYAQGQLYTALNKDREFLKKEGEFNSLVYQLACGLEHMHDQEIAHRDVKPENIVFENGRYVWIDFGFSKKKKDVFNPTEGSPMFLPPRVKRNDDQIKRDVYGFATTLYDLLTNRDEQDEPVWSVGKAAENEKVLNNLSKHPQFRELKVDEPIKTLILRGLSLNEKERPTMKEFREAAQKLLGDQRIEQIPGPSWFRQSKPDFREGLRRKTESMKVLKAPESVPELTPEDVKPKKTPQKGVPFSGTIVQKGVLKKTWSLVPEGLNNYPGSFEVFHEKWGEPKTCRKLISRDGKTVDCVFEDGSHQKIPDINFHYKPLYQ